MLAGDEPIVGSVSASPETLNGERSVSVWAENVTSLGIIEKVMGVVIPSNASNGNSPLPTFELSSVGNGRYEGSAEGFQESGTHNIVVYATDREEKISSPRMVPVEQAFAATVSNPVFSPGSGEYTASLEVEISCDTPDALIRCTTDGSDPTEESPAYGAPIDITAGMTLRAKAFRPGWNASQIVSAEYTIKTPDLTVSDPVFSPGSGEYTAPLKVGISCDTPDAVICCTTDGSDPTEDSPICETPTVITADMTLKAKAFRPGWNASQVVSAEYVITEPDDSPGDETGDPPDDTEPSGDESGENDGDASDGADEDHAEDDTASPSDTETSPKETVSTPFFVPGSGQYEDSVRVRISCDTQGATIRYTADGSEPTDGSAIYASPITVSENTAIRAKAFKDGCDSSEITSANYEIQIRYALSVTKTGKGTVSSDPTGINCGTDCQEDYDKGTSVSLTATPDEGWETEKWNPVCGDAETCQVAMNGDQSVSVIFRQKTVSAPVFSPDAGQYDTSVEVGLSCATPGATIHYTTDGSEPSEISAAYGDTSILVSQNTSIRAKAFKDGYKASETVSASYEIWQRLSVTTTGNGTVSSEPSGIDCGADCQESYDDEDVTVSLIATPDEGWEFERWDQDCEGAEECQVAMETGKTVSAIFRELPLRGDISGDGIVDMADAIIALKMVTGLDISDLISSGHAMPDGDSNGDGNIGIPEAAYALGEASKAQ